MERDEERGVTRSINEMCMAAQFAKEGRESRVASGHDEPENSDIPA